MSEKKAKKFRKEIYKDVSSNPQKTRYILNGAVISSVGLRRAYQQAKKCS